MLKKILNSTLQFSVLAFFLLINANLSFAQQEDVDSDDAPPPLIKLSKTESEQLKSESDFKQRTTLCLQIAANYLQRAESSTGAADFQEALNDLGGYQASIENGLNFLQSHNNNDNRKIRDNLRRLEMALRAQTPRLETIRRSTPAEYGAHLKSILNFTRKARTLALDAFFSDTVLPNN